MERFSELYRFRQTLEGKAFGQRTMASIEARLNKMMDEYLLFINPTTAAQPVLGPFSAIG
jgi:hypothetical protein